MARGQDLSPLVPLQADERFEASLELEWPIEGAEPSKREGLIFTRHAARVDPADVDAG